MPVSHTETNPLGVAQPLQGVSNLLGQFRQDLHGVDLFCQEAEHRALIAASGAEFEYAGALPQEGERGHPRDDVRLADALPLSDGERAVRICQGLELRRNELLPRHGGESLEHSRLRDALELEGLEELAPAHGRIGRCRLTSIVRCALRMGQRVWLEPGTDVPSTTLSMSFLFFDVELFPKLFRSLSSLLVHRLDPDFFLHLGGRVRSVFSDLFEHLLAGFFLVGDNLGLCLFITTPGRSHEKNDEARKGLDVSAKLVFPVRLD